MLKKLSIFIGSVFFTFSLSAGVTFANFQDLPKDSRYAPAIKSLEAKGIVSGKEFYPDKPITKEEFAEWILKMNGFNAASYVPRSSFRFQDINLNTASGKYAQYLLDAGIISIDSRAPLFRPKSSILKLHALQILFSLEGVPIPKIFDEKNFSVNDVNITSRGAPLVAKALSIGILKPGNVGLYQKLSRKEAAYFIDTLEQALARQSGELTVTLYPVGNSNNHEIIRNEKFDLLTTTWDYIQQKYIKKNEVNKENLVYGAIEGMVKELKDPHSDFERAGKTSTADSLSGELEGIGAVIQMKDEKIVIVSPIDNSPAEKAGLKPNDVILTVDGVAVAGFTLHEVVSRIKGKAGTEVTLTVLRGTETLSFTITRAVVKIVSVSTKLTDDNIQIIKIINFGELTELEFMKAMTEISRNKPKGLVLDLRNNPGGYLDTAVTLAGFFVKQGEIVSRISYPNRTEDHSSQGSAVLAKYPTVVLVNEGSASASEILAGALQDHGIAKVIGEKTFGKGSVQELTNFQDGSTLKLTVAEWLTPKGRSIEKAGIVPDIEVIPTKEDEQANRDPQLDRALAELRK